MFQSRAGILVPRSSGLIYGSSDQVAKLMTMTYRCFLVEERYYSVRCSDGLTRRESRCIAVRRGKVKRMVPGNRSSII